MAFAYCTKCEMKLATWKEASKPCPSCGEEAFLPPQEIMEYRITELEKIVEKLKDIVGLK